MWDKLRPIVSLVLFVTLAFWLVACGGKTSKLSRVNNLSISEVSPPAEIQRLNRSLDRYMPQVTILSPARDEVLDRTDVAVTVAVKDLPIFKSELGLGNHLDVVLDERESQEIYDPATPAIFSNVTPGTHTIRVFASRPWDESFKNEGAYAQSTFHVLTRTGENVPRSDTPILTYHSPIGMVGSDTVLLDFYLHNAPVPPSLLDSKEPSSWQVRATVNGESFAIEDWHSLYLKGLKPGRNWIRLEFLDNGGNPMPNITNSIAQIITYDPSLKDTKSLLLQGQTIPGIDQIVDPNFIKPVPPAPVEEPVTKLPEVEVKEPSPEVPSTPEKAPRFQLFKKKAKVAPLPEPVEEVQKEKPIDNNEQKPIDSVTPSEEKPIEVPPVSAKEEATPTEQVEQPIENTKEEVTPTEDKTPKTGRFQSLKARYQKMEQTNQEEVPLELSE